MAFVNEFVSPEDAREFGLQERDDRLQPYGNAQSRQWTVDRERRIYLRVLAFGREESSHVTSWTLSWKGLLLRIEIESLRMLRDESDRVVGAHMRILAVHPLDAEAATGWSTHRQQILDSLAEALRACKDGGVYSSVETFDAVIDLAEGV